MNLESTEFIVVRHTRRRALVAEFLPRGFLRTERVHVCIVANPRKLKEIRVTIRVYHKTLSSASELRRHEM